MKLDKLEGKKILIVGRGVEGAAIEEYLARHLLHATIVSVDKKDGELYLANQKNFDIAIKSPGVPGSLISIPYTTATNIFLENAKGKVIGVTGTKGKSTTASLIFAMLRSQGLDAYLGGNIGRSPLDFIDELTDSSWTVLEMSSFQLADVIKSPHIAVLLMIAPEHIDFHGTLENYIQAKRNILAYQTAEDFAVINRDYLPSHESDMVTAGTVFQASRERECAQGCYIKEKAVWIRKNDAEFKVIDRRDILLLGEHNLENVCAASMAAFLAGVTKENIAQMLRIFKGLDHRLEYVGEVQGVLYYNDSLATIPAATIQALEALKETETLIAGGHDRGLDYTELGAAIAKSSVKTLLLFPATGEKIWEAVAKANGKQERIDVLTMTQAIAVAKAETAPGKICLMSPASASFGIFKDYKDRGEQFKKAVLSS